MPNEDPLARLGTRHLRRRGRRERDLLRAAAGAGGGFVNLRTAARAVSYLARDILPALQRFAAPPDDDNPDAYAEHLARVRAEALSDREAQTEVAEPSPCPGQHRGCDGSFGECYGCHSDGTLTEAGERLYEAETADCGLGGGDELTDYEAGYQAGRDNERAGVHPDESLVGINDVVRVMRLCQPQPSSAAAEPGFTAWLASLDARLAAIQDHLTSAAPGATFTPDAAPESPAPDTGAGAGHPGFPNWCAAEMRQVADILLTADSPFALGYANDLRRAAATRDEDERQK